MKVSTLFLCFFGCVTLSFAQRNGTIAGDGNTTLPSSSERFRYINPFDGRDIPTKGERYFYDSTYRAGEMWTTDGKYYKNGLLFRFDQIERTLQVRYENGRETYLQEATVSKFEYEIEGQKVTFVNRKLPHNHLSSLLQVIYYSPNLQLLRDSRKFIYRVKSDFIDGYSSEAAYDEVRKDYRYYIGIKNNPLVKVTIDEKSFAKALPNQKIQIAKLFKEAKKKGALNITKVAGIMAELDKPKI
jgi:hypothetical protein